MRTDLPISKEREQMKTKLLSVIGALLALLAAAWVGLAAGRQPTPAAAALPAAEDETLPAFKFSLGAQKLHIYDGGTAKQVTAIDFPVSKSIAGVLMTLDAGALRELHWHANAAEWAYVFEGNVRVTVFDPEGRSEVDDLEPGDLWYFPRGHGHSLEGLGPGATKFMLVFDNGYFSEFATFSVTDWIAQTPKEIVAKNLGLSIEAVEAFPRKEVYISKGPIPTPLERTEAHGGPQPAAPLSHKFRLLATRPVVSSPVGEAWLASQREFPISTTMTGLFVRLQPGGLRELHWHPNADEWQYISKGKMRLTVFASSGRSSVVELGPGDVGFVPMGYGHALENVGDEPAEALFVLNSGSYQEISFTAWLASNPRYLLETNFGLPAAVIDRLPRAERFFAGPSD
ncbi:Oxalate decarboxylase [Minicystis rosea]|nr:Oxalate decarboxylase [Minicystis rosea]